MLPMRCLVRVQRSLPHSARWQLGAVSLNAPCVFSLGRCSNDQGKQSASGLHRRMSSRSAALSSYYQEAEELSWEAVERAASEKIARHRRKGKNRVIMAGPEVMPRRKQRSSVVFEGIPRRRNVLLTGSRSERMDFCDRIITEDFLHADECRAIVNATQAAIQSFVAQGPDVSFIPLQPSTEDLIGSYGYGLILSALHRMRMELREDYHLPELYFAGALLSRLTVAGGSDDDPIPNTAYWNPHIDKSNKKEYDYSAIIYLNTQRPPAAGAEEAAPDTSSGFLGGSFVFLDADADRVVQPLAGRLLSFTSGFENPHEVEKVTSGYRFALSAWFTTDARCAYPTQL